MSVKKIKLPDGSVVDINDSRIHIYRTLTGTAADTVSPYSHTKWDVTDSTITEYVDGMVVCLKVPVAGNGIYGTGLQINDLGYKPVVYNVNSMISTRYSVGSIVWCVYNATQTASLYINSTSAVTVTGCWQVMDYDTSTREAYAVIDYYFRPYAGAEPIYRYKLCAMGVDNRMVPITVTNQTSETLVDKAPTQVGFRPHKIWLYNTTGTVNAGAVFAAQKLYSVCYSPTGCLYNFNTDVPTYRLIFLRGKYNKKTDLFTLRKDAGSPCTSYYAVVPMDTANITLSDYFSADDWYILVGCTYSTANYLSVFDNNPMFYFDGTNLVQGQTALNPTKVSELDDMAILSPSDGQALVYNDTSGKWVNSDITTEVLMCTLTASGTSDPDTGEWTMSYSCDKTDAEIYAAYVANKSVLLKVVGEDHSWDTNAPETYTIYRLALAQSSTGGNNEPWYFFSFQNSTSSLYETIKIVSPTALPSFVYLLHIDRVSGDLSNTTLSSVTPGWYFSSDSIRKPQNATIGNLAEIRANGVYDDSGISKTSVSTAVTNSHTHSNKTVLDYIPASLGTAGQVLKVNSGATGLEFGTVSGGLSDHDFTHTANTTISSSTTTVTFAANTRGTAMLTISADLGLTIACNNGSDNYIWVKNTGSSDVDITISAVTQNSTNVSNVYMPSDGITVPAGGLCELGIIVNVDGAFITSRNDLTL